MIMKKNEEPKPPSLFKMIRTFGSELAKYVKEGAPNVSPEDYALRLDTCMQCPQLIKSSMRCGSCGCLLETKAKWTEDRNNLDVSIRYVILGIPPTVDSLELALKP